MSTSALTITLDRAAGTAEMRRGQWHQTVPISDLPRQLRFYLGLWSRKRDARGRAPDLKTPGPWAEHYEADIRALRRAITDSEAPI